MINERHKQILILAVRAGELLMKNGAETYRVEDTIERICRACRIPYVEVFATQTGIFISIDSGEADSDVFTYVKRIEGGTGTDLKKISEVNKFSRDFASDQLTINDGIDRMKEIGKISPLPFAVRLIGASLIASFFSIIFGGSWADFICAIFVGAVSYSLSVALNKVAMNYFMTGFCCCALAALLSLIAATLFPVVDYTSLLIGTLMIFVPGGAITISMRDFFSGHMLSGLAKAAEAFLIALSLATGAGVVLGIWNALGGVI